MADALAPIADKLKPFIRLLSSDQPGEVIAAARALNRVLKNNGADIHVLADAIGQPNGKLSKAEMQRLYDAGFEAGKRAAENGPMFRNINLDEEPGWNEIARECAAHPGRMKSDREKKLRRRHGAAYSTSRRANTKTS
jgi:hypothetical protein